VRSNAPAIERVDNPDSPPSRSKTQHPCGLQPRCAPDQWSGAEPL